MLLNPEHTIRVLSIGLYLQTDVSAFRLGLKISGSNNSQNASDVKHCLWFLCVRFRFLFEIKFCVLVNIMLKVSSVALAIC